MTDLATTGERQIPRDTRVQFRDRRHKHSARVAVAGVFLLTWGVALLFGQALSAPNSDTDRHSKFNRTI